MRIGIYASQAAKMVDDFDIRDSEIDESFDDADI
jgi:hypothetical protein